ncbi:MAG: hypothetical protein DDT32_01482 [Syntrophomonadaceae bacterium]|nr:hypothetical protein [Bacillota bacterium]MBT9147717.1 hypothetical protein [Bacillota bacterium]
MARNKKNGKFRNRRGHTLFIDARKMGELIDRIHRELSDEEIGRIAGTYHAWRLSACGNAQAGGDVGADGNSPEYKDVPGFCKSITTGEMRDHGYVLTPGRYVGAEAQADECEPFDGKMNRLVVQLREQQAEAARLDAAIWRNMEDLGYA